MTDSPRPTQDSPRPTQGSEGTARPDAAPSPAAPAAPRPRPQRPSRRRRFIVTLAAAAAGFVIVFQFLALQLQAGNDPAIGTTAAPVAQGAHVASAPATNGSSPVVTRTSAGATSTPVSATQPGAAPAATAGHANTRHPVLTSASGAGGRGHSDDLD